MTFREICTEIHGMLFGGFFLLAAYAFFVEVWRMYNGQMHRPYTKLEAVWERSYMLAALLSGWLAVLTGTFLIYPWYRAAPPRTGGDLGLYPKFRFLADPHTAALHTFGMEWKEHVGFIAPIAMTAAVYIWLRYRGRLQGQRVLRNGVLLFAGAALFATAVAAVVGALLNKAAPVQGG